MKEQLRNTLMERKREAKKAFDVAGALSRDAALRPAGARAGKKNDDSTLKVTPLLHTLSIIARRYLKVEIKQRKIVKKENYVTQVKTRQSMWWPFMCTRATRRACAHSML